MRNVSTPSRQQRVDCTDTFGRCLDLCIVDRLHQPWRREQECCVRRAPRRWNHLSTTAVDGFLSNGGLRYANLHTAHRLVTQRSFARGPLEALLYVLTHRVQERLVDILRQRIVNQHIWPVLIRAKCPNGPCSERVPAVPVLEYTRQGTWRLVQVDQTPLQVFGDPFFQRLGNQCQPVLLVRCVCIALHRTGLDDRLTEFDNWITDLDLHVRVQLSQVVHHTVQVELTCA